MSKVRRVKHIKEIEVGQKVKAVRIVDEMTYRKALVGMSKKDKRKWVKDNTFKGKVVSVDKGRGIFIIELPNGQQEIIDIIRFIVDILPLIEVLIDGIARLWNKVFKKKSGRTF